MLDLGLAKFGSDGTNEPGAEGLSNLPTVSVQATQAGVILGTPAYMAPEQAKGHPVDGRADIFAFGCILYEMLTGRLAFEGDSLSDTLSRVLQREPDWTRVPTSVPPSIHRLMRLCLEKDPRKRRQSAGDVRIDLEHALTEPAAESPAAIGRRSRLAWIMSTSALSVLVVALAIPAAIHFREAPPHEMRPEIVTPPTLDPLHFALSPNGRYIVFVAAGSSSDAAQRLYLRALEKTDEQPIPGTDGARLPFWSGDSRSVGFFASGKLFRIDIFTGGPAQELAPAANPQGGAWNADGTILFAPTTVSPLFSVPASGGDLVAVTKLDSPRQSNHRRPSFLPDGRQFLFYAQGVDQEVSGIYLGSLDGDLNRAPKPTDSRR